MEKSRILLALFALAPPLWAGTEIKALVEGSAYKEAWIDLGTVVSDGHLKVHFKGPWCLGSLIYDRETSQLTIVDEQRKTVIVLTQENQAALKVIGALSSAKLMGQITGSTPSAKKTFAMVKENAQAFFNGTPFLKESGQPKAGLTCDHYETDWNGQKTREVWTTEPAAAGVDGEDFNTIRGLAHLLLDLCGSELAQLGADTTFFQQNLPEAPLPVFADLYTNGKHTGRFQILSVRSRDIAPGSFAPPSSYKVLGLLDLLK